METSSEASYGDDKEDRPSVSGIVAKFVGAALSWLSKTRASVRLSSLKAENIALGDCAKGPCCWEQSKGWLVVS